MKTKAAKTHSKQQNTSRRKTFEDWLKQNGLSIVTVSIFILCWIGQSIAGFHVYNDEARLHKSKSLSYPAYLASPAFWEATTENWESEYLQLAAMVLLTVYLRQKGSAQSKPINPNSKDEIDFHHEKNTHNLRTLIYQNSLGLTLLALFFLCFAGHASSSFEENNDDRREHGQSALTFTQYLQSPQLWFESLQNWQSEFLAVSSLTLLSIALRQKGSAESKEPNAPDSKTGK